jgi:hypothetical protein
VERWRLLGREVRIIDHDASQQRRRLRKLQGRDVIQTDQGFNLTEDQFYLREDWPPPDPQILKDYEEFEKMPSVEEIVNALRRRRILRGEIKPRAFRPPPKAAERSVAAGAGSLK